jgi:hypothetical protein
MDPFGSEAEHQDASVVSVDGTVERFKRLWRHTSGDPNVHLVRVDRDQHSLDVSECRQMRTVSKAD